MRLAAKIFFNKIIVNKPFLLKEEGPLLIAANHPNSFLDAVLLDILFEKPIWSLARGDVFKKPFYIRLLTKLKILPVYRTREGVENLEANYKTFDACKEIFRKNGLILIFSEGLCVNEWHLRPLKKGTARLAISAWEEGIPLNVLPLGINYSSFRRFGKNVFVNAGEVITAGDINMNDADGKRNITFNNLLQAQLRQLVFEIPAEDIALQKQKLSVPFPNWLKMLLWPAGATGYLLHAPLYISVKAFIQHKVKEPGHFDSMVLGLLVLLYPLYVFIIAVILWLLDPGGYSFLSFAVLPLLAWAFVKAKKKI